MRFHSRETLVQIQPKQQAIKNYNRISTWYDFLAGRSEQRIREEGLRQLDPKAGEILLEIGFGTGRCIIQLAQAVGNTGKVCGIDISDRMVAIAKGRAEAAGYSRTTELCCDDALNLPYPDESFDGLFMSFTLETLGTQEIGPFLRQCKRVSRTDGRVCIISMSAKGKHGVMMRLYEWAHANFPNTIDCRPIDAEQLLLDAGFAVTGKKAASIWGLPVDIVISRVKAKNDLN
ncbi:MAG TPA: methyltransferase domain-containing protein [Spirochaetia bacterium]|nr:methyltransferase domain-containing protein [Spirochaetia bacterium]